MNDDWKLQVSYKTPSGDMINVRANTADELSILLEGIGDYSTQIAATQSKIVGSYTLAPLSTTSSTTNTTPLQSSTTTQGAGQSNTPSSNPTCVHGARIFRSGVSKKTGQPYAFWSCPQPQGADQCKPVN